MTKTILMLSLLFVLNSGSLFPEEHSSESKDSTDQSSKILFSKKKSGNSGWSIYSMNPDGTDEKIVIPLKSGMGEYNPSISPDGETILFNTYRYGGWKLAAFDTKTGGISRITMGGSYYTNGVFSPDGTKIAYEKSIGRSTHICIANKDGSNERVLTSQMENAENRIPAWNPDGKAIYFYSNGSGSNGINDIFVYTISSNSIKNLTINTGGNDFAPSVSPDGKQIAFFSDRNGYLDLYMMDVSGDNQQNFSKNLQNENNEYNYYTDANIYWVFKCSWSPDGNQLVFTSGHDGNIDLYTIQKDGSSIKRLTNTELTEYTPVWGLLK